MALPFQDVSNGAECYAVLFLSYVELVNTQDERRELTFELRDFEVDRR